MFSLAATADGWTKCSTLKEEEPQGIVVFLDNQFFLIAYGGAAVYILRSALFYSPVFSGFMSYDISPQSQIWGPSLSHLLDPFIQASQLKE